MSGYDSPIRNALAELAESGIEVASGEISISVGVRNVPARMRGLSGNGLRSVLEEFYRDPTESFQLVLKILPYEDRPFVVEFCDLEESEMRLVADSLVAAWTPPARRSSNRRRWSDRRRP